MRFSAFFLCFCAVCIILKKSSKSKVEVPCAPSVLLSLLSNPIRSRATGVIGLLESIWNHLENISDFFLAIFAYLWTKIEKILSLFLSLQFVDYAVKIPADADVKFCSVCHYNVVALSSWEEKLDLSKLGASLRWTRFNLDYNPFTRSRQFKSKLTAYNFQF